MRFEQSSSRRVAAFVIAAGFLAFPARSPREPARQRAASAPAPAPAPAASSLREQELDTETPLPEKPKKPEKEVETPPGPKPRCVSTQMPPNGNPRVKTPDDADLPAWVPKCGRLTVIEASDLPENLGLIPLGSAKRGVRVTVAEILAAREAEAPAPIEPVKTQTYIPDIPFVGSY